MSYNTVCKLFVDAGRACAEYQDHALRNLSCKRLQLDEIWSFVYAKEKNVKGAKRAPKNSGDAWTWVAIDADTKLVSRHGASEIAATTQLVRSYVTLQAD